MHYPSEVTPAPLGLINGTLVVAKVFCFALLLVSKATNFSDNDRVEEYYLHGCDTV
jgi:hypothetical protein